MAAPETLMPTTHGPLAGHTVLVTRAREQAPELSTRLRAAGAAVVEYPAIAIEDPESWADLDAALARLSSYDWVVFTSANGVRQVARRLAETGRGSALLAALHLAAIGPATASALAAHGLRAALVPREYRAEGVAAAFDAVPLSGARILLPRAAVARDVLPSLLRRRGAVVDVVTAYRAVATAAEGDVESVRAGLESGTIDVVAFASSGTVRSFVEGLGPDGAALIARTAVAAIGPITAETVRGYGLTVAVEATEYTMDGLVHSLVAALGKRRGAPRTARSDP